MPSASKSLCKTLQSLAGEKCACDDGTYREISYEISEDCFSNVVTSGYNAKWQRDDDAKQDTIPLQLIYCK